MPMTRSTAGVVETVSISGGSLYPRDAVTAFALLRQIKKWTYVRDRSDKYEKRVAFSARLNDHAPQSPSDGLAPLR